MKESIEDRIRLIMGNLAALRESINPAYTLGMNHLREHIEDQRLELKKIADEIKLYSKKPEAPDGK